MPRLNLARLGSELTGWSDKGGTAAYYNNGGSNYRTYQPTVSMTPVGGLFISTKIDHIRGGDQDDHNQLEMEFDRDGHIVSTRSVMTIQGTPQFDTGLVKAAADLDDRAGKIAEVSAKILNSLMSFISGLNEHGGRANFPAVVQHNLHRIADCIEPGARDIATVETTAEKDAGTDAGVYLTLYGRQGESGERELDNDEQNFEAGKTDVFTLETEDLGAIHKIRIRHDNMGKYPGWHLSRIVVQREDTNDRWVFPCRRWLAKDAENGGIDLPLPCVPDVPSDGDLWGERSRPEVYVMYGGAKFYIPSVDEFSALGFSWSTILEVPNGELIRIPDMPQDGTLLRERSYPEVYVIRGDGGRTSPVGSGLKNWASPRVISGWCPTGRWPASRSAHLLSTAEALVIVGFLTARASYHLSGI
jgi:hypothetical protein